MDGVSGTVKNIIFRKVQSDFVTIIAPLEFHQAVLKFVPWIHTVYLADADVLSEPENIEQKNIPETLTVHHIERFQMKGVYALKFFHLAEDEQPFYTQWYVNGKDVVICGHESSEFDDNHCASCHEDKEKRKSGYNAPDYVSNGTMSSAFIIEFRSLFVLVYSFFSFLF